MILHNPDLVLNFHRYSYNIPQSDSAMHNVHCIWNIMFKNWCKYTHDRRTTMLPEIHNASIFYGTQSVTPDTSTSHMRLAEYSQTKDIHSPHLKHPQCVPKKVTDKICWSHGAPAQSLLAGTPCFWQSQQDLEETVYENWSFLTIRPAGSSTPKSCSWEVLNFG